MVTREELYSILL